MTGARVANLLGFLFNVVGAAVVSASFVTTWRTYGQGPLFPLLARAVASARSIFARGRSVHASVTGVSGTLATGRVHGVARHGFPDDLSVEGKVSRLIEGYKALGNEIEANRREAESANQATTDRLGRLDERWTQDHVRLETMVRDIAIGDVRPQLVGVILVLVGTTLSLWANFLTG